MLNFRKALARVILVSSVVLSGCTTEKFIDNTVDLAAGTTKAVANGVVSVGKAAVNGTKKLVTNE